MHRWHILTGEYPPQKGGVADYTRRVAQALAACGDDVRVWCPATNAPHDEATGVRVHRLQGHFGPRCVRQIESALRRETKPYRLLVQYVPHMYGCRGMNLYFCGWLSRFREGDAWVMFHEVAFPLTWKQPLKHRMLSLAQKLMAALMVRAAHRLFVSIPLWEDHLIPLMRPRRSVEWLPIPSTLPAKVDPARVDEVRRRFETVGRPVIGHFGTYPESTQHTLSDVFARLLHGDPARRGWFLGWGSLAFVERFRAKEPQLANRLHAFDDLSAADLSLHLKACDLLVQPYVDGASSRRTSLMAGLALGVPQVTTDGPLSEPLWRESGAVALAAPGDGQALARLAEELLNDPNRRARLGHESTDLYRTRFRLEAIVDRLRA